MVELGILKKRKSKKKTPFEIWLTETGEAFHLVRESIPFEKGRKVRKERGGRK